MSNFIELLHEAAALIDAGQLAHAEDVCHSVLFQKPRHQIALFLLGVVARRTNRAELAIDCLSEAKVAPSQDGLRQTELGLAYLQLGQTAAAETALRAAILASPDTAEAYLNLGALLEQSGRWPEALAALDRSAELAPQCAVTQYNRGNVLRQQVRLDDAISAYQKSVALDSGFPRAHWNLSLALLLTGDFERGWEEYEWRGPSGEVALDQHPQPRWQGEPLHDRTLLIHAEQGIGDEILFASCLPDLIPRTKQTLIVCDPRLEKLYQRSFPIARVFGRGRRKDRQPAELPETCDLQIPAGSVPRFLRSSAAAFPARKRFLLPDPKLRREWVKRFESLGPGQKVGISWQAGGQPAERKRRSIPLTNWQWILGQPGCQFINLQYGESHEELAVLKSEHGITVYDWPEADPLIDLDAFAAKVAALDLVISVGNATVHMAGALGVAAWAMLPQVPGWRWNLTGSQSIWYPSVRLFRQSDRGDWLAVLAEIATELASRLEQPVAAPLTVAAPRAFVPVEDRQAMRRLHDLPQAFRRALKAYEQQDFPQATELCADILRHNPRYFDALRLSATLARQAGRNDEAIRLLQRAVAVQPRNPDLALEVGGLLQISGQVEAALVQFQQAVTLRPDHAKSFNALGGVYWQLQQALEAIAAFEQATRLQPDYMAAHHNRGLVLQAVGRHDEALVCFRQAAELAPDSEQAAGNLRAALQLRHAG